MIIAEKPIISDTNPYKPILSKLWLNVKWYLFLTSGFSVPASKG